MKDFNAFMYGHKLQHERKHFCCYYLLSFSTEEILKRYVKDCFKINGKKSIVCQSKVGMLDSKNLKEEKITIYYLCRVWKHPSTRR